MAQVLRQSTQVVVRIGPAVAVGDGFTPVTTLDLSTADEAELLKAAGAATVSIAAATFAAIASVDGWYDLTLTTSHTDTVGTLDIVINDDSLILPIFARFQVIEEAVFDDLYAASAPGIPTAAEVVNEWESQSQADPTGFHVNVIEIGGTAQTANDNGADINAILVDTDVIGAAGAGLTEAGGTGDHLTALATAANLATVAGYLDTEIAAILADTDELQQAWADGGRLDLILDARASQTTADAILTDTDVIGAAGAGLTALATAANLTTVDTVVDAIKVQTDKFVFTVANQVDANTQSINDTALTGDGGATPWGPA